MTNPDIAAVAAGLTKAQLEAINDLWQAPWHDGPRVSASAPTKAAMRRKGLIDRVSALTPLGLAVRAFLTTDEQAMKEGEHG